MLLASRINLVGAILSVITSSFNLEVFILSTAGPDKTPCVIYAETLLAPDSIKASAALHKVPAVSTISSTIIQSLPLIFPIIFLIDIRKAMGYL